MHENASVIWDTTAPRHLALAGGIDVLLKVTGLVVPRAVADPLDPRGSDLLHSRLDQLSEIAQAEARFVRDFDKELSTNSFHAANALAALRGHPDLRVIDLTEEEEDDVRVFASDGFLARHGLLAPLGRGEQAVLAISGQRGWVAGLDDGTARRVAGELGIAVITTQQLLLRAVAELHLTRPQADSLYARLLRGGFYGPPDLDS